MKLWIDGQSLQTASRQRGIGRYVRELIRAVAEGDYGFDLSISFNAGMSDEAIAARDHVKQWIQPGNIHVWQGVAEAGEADEGYTQRRRLSEIALAHHVTCLQPDIALSASPFEGAGDVTVPLSAKSIPNTFTASIFYDAIPHRYANQYLTDTIRRSYYYRRLAFYKDFDLNLCISEYSKSEIIDLSGNKRSVNISAGVSSDFISMLRNEGKSNSRFHNSKTVLNVGSLDWRKNVGVLVEAFALLPDFLRQEIKLVLAGDHLPAQLDRIRARWNEQKLPPANLITLGHVSDRDLVSLYQSADLVVQPSLLEGFGLTALEAMSCGTPVIGSATGALPEILDPDLLFDPTKPQQIADRIARTFLEPDFSASHAAKGMERARQFSWQKSAELATRAMLEARGKDRRPNVLDRTNARKQTLQQLEEIVVPLDLIIGTMARAEPEAPSPKRLLVDATSTVRIDHGTGIQRVTKETVRNLVRINSQSDLIVTYCDGADGVFRVDVDPGKISFVKTSEKVRLLGGDTILMLDSSWEFHREHLPILLAARQRGAEVISCLFDLVPVRQEAMCHPGIPPIFVAWLQSALAYSTGFVCISKAVADELYAMLEAIRFPRTLKIGFWHLGADFAASAREQSSKSTDLCQKRYSFLMVGTIEPRKGHRVAIDAFEILWKEGLDVELIVVGKPGWESDQLIDRLKLHPTAGTRLRWYPSAKDDELQRHYYDCDALIAASFVEGFGLPLVEAMHFGKPVIASDIPVFREVTQDGTFAHFFEVGSSFALAAAIRDFITRSDGGNEPPVKDLPWSSWSTSATQLQNVLVKDNWYRIYKPGSFKPYASIFDHGTILMKGPLDVEGRRHHLTLIEGPIILNQKLRYILRVTNLSEQVWSSRSVKDGAWGVFLSYRLLNPDGGAIISETPRFGIPFVMIPGDSHYMAIEIPRNAREDATVLAIEMFQENVSWWGNPLRLNLRDQDAH